MTGSPLAENLARIRKSRDLSQEELAEAASVGVDTVARIEQGARAFTRPSTLQKLAAALGVTTGALLGTSQTSHSRDVDITPLRKALNADSSIAGLNDFVETREVLPLPELTNSAHRAWRNYVDGEHSELLHALPAVLTDARRAVRENTNEQRAGACRVLSTAYRLGAGIAGRLGFDDLAYLSAAKAVDAARASDSPDVQTAISLRYLAWTLVRQGRLEDAERVATAAAAAVEPRMLDRDPIRAGVFGNLLFNAASAALSRRAGGRAEDLLAAAQAAAVRSRGDTASEAAIFGPRVAALQRVDWAVRTGDPERALQLAAAVPTVHGDVPAFWEAGHRLFLASAAVQTRQERKALTWLREARDLAPDWVRYQPLGTATMKIVVDQATRRRGSEFAALAAHYGVVDSPSA